MDETRTPVDDAEGDLETFVNQLDQGDNADDEGEDWIEQSAVEKLREVELQLGLVPRQPADEQEVDRGTDG